MLAYTVETRSLQTSDHRYVRFYYDPIICQIYVQKFSQNIYKYNLPLIDHTPLPAKKSILH